MAILRGYLGRKGGDGYPGSEVLWRGMTRLADIEIVYELYANLQKFLRNY